jgi:hypothetical protein
VLTEEIEPTIADRQSTGSRGAGEGQVEGHA